MSETLLLILFIVFSIIISISGSHFEGGFITWKPQNSSIKNQNPVPIILTQRYILSRLAFYCDDSTIANGSLIGIYSYVQCISLNCVNISFFGPMAAPCVAYSVAHNFSIVENSTVVNLPPNITIEAAYQDGNWINALRVGGGGFWSVSTQITTIPRSDGTYNTPPSSSTPTTKILTVGSTYTWQISVTDVDGDIVRCRWAQSGPPDECASVCNGFSGALLDNQTCTMTYAAMSVGNWVVALKAEDFEFEWQTTPLSGTSIQFIVSVLPVNSLCMTVPIYLGKRSPNECIFVNVNSTVNDTVQFLAGCSNISVSEIDIIKPANMIASKLVVDSYNSSLYTMTITWMPTISELNVNLVCYTPADSISQQGSQTCIRYCVMDSSSPSYSVQYINGSMSPVGQVHSNQSIWQIAFSQTVRRPSLDAYIRFYMKSTNQQIYAINVRLNLSNITYYNRTLTFFTSTTWTLNEQYYILFDNFVVSDPNICGSQSPAIVDPNFWTFHTPITTTTTVTPATESSCVIPLVTLIPDGSSLLNPIKIRRSRDFYLSSNITLFCKKSLSTTIKWTIYECTSKCSVAYQLDRTIATTLGEIMIPAKTLPYGVYQFRLTVSMSIAKNLAASAVGYIRIVPTGITANLVQFGTSFVTRGSQQEIVFDPGRFSGDLDQNLFNISTWKYEYYCRIYGVYDFPNLQGSLLTIDDPRIDPHNPSCFSNRTGNQISWQYNGVYPSSKSSVTFLSNTFLPNQVYQLMVSMENRENSSLQATGFSLISIINGEPPLISILCIISPMCIPNLEFQNLNPTTQVSLMSICVGNCNSLVNIQWRIYQGFQSNLTGIVHWILFNQTNQYENIWFFGINTMNFTALKDFFSIYSQIEYWRFEVTYTFVSTTSISALHFLLNRPPQNGSCQIEPQFGTINTLFNISCSNWIDEDDIQDYSLDVWTTDYSQRLFIGFSSLSTFQVRLPSGSENSSLLNLMISIRDYSNCVTEYNLSPIIVQFNNEMISNFLNNLFSNSILDLNQNLYTRLLSSGNQNSIVQIVNIFTQEFNRLNSQILLNALSNNIPLSNIFISSLTDSTLQQNYIELNETAMIEYKQQLNQYSNLHDYLINFLVNLSILNSNSIKLQTFALVQLTQSTNQLTRSTLILTLEKCSQLVSSLSSYSRKISYEDIQMSVSLIYQLMSNIEIAINGPLQNRTVILDKDLTNANEFPSDYDTDLESAWNQYDLLMINKENSIEINRNLYYQKQLATQIQSEINRMNLILRNILNIHLNLNQQYSLNSSEMRLLYRVFANEYLFKFVNQTKMSYQSMIKPMAVADLIQSETLTNLSRSLTISYFDEHQNEISIVNQSIEFFINRDVNLNIPLKIYQNVTSMNSITNNQDFSLHYINLTSKYSFSLHIEIDPLNETRTYLFIYKFDQIPILNRSMNQIDGWTVFYPANLTNENLYKYFLNNKQTETHQSIVFGIRELNSSEYFNQTFSSPPIPQTSVCFSSNYALRIYSSGCYYLNSNHSWQSDGILVGPLTTYNRTQCISTHLTTFASSFLVLPLPVNWSYVFSHGDFAKNKTIYITVICICIIYLILLIYSRYYDRKDREKLEISVLSDNHQADDYFYQIIVFTGHRTHSGTDSKVHFLIQGENTQTSIRTFSNVKRKIFQCNGIDSFLMSVEKSLGYLHYIRIWHDNSGDNNRASWFLKYLIIRDLQTNERFYFIAQRWFAVEKDDGNIERVLYPADENERQKLSYLLSKSVYFNISNNHLWYSIFSRPISKRFTCVQRCTCCFVLLFLSMFLNILYYNQTNDNNNNQTILLTIYSIKITSEQIGISLIIELVSLIPSIFLVQLFQRIESDKKQRFLPWWFVYVGYTISLSLIGLSIFFILVRGIEFGDMKTQKWLISIVTGWFSSICLIQPLKIISLTIFLTIFCRKSNENREESEYLNENENYSYLYDKDTIQSIKRNSIFIYRAPIRIKRLNKTELDLARFDRLKQIRMWSIIQEFLFHFIFLSILSFLIYKNQNSNQFFQVQHLKNYLQKSTDEILTTNQFWYWLENDFVNDLRAQQWYNQDTPRYLNGYLNDKTNRILGWARMRQIRIRTNLCRVQSMQKQCLYDYENSNEEKDSFEPGWMRNQTDERFSSSIFRAFQYQANNREEDYELRGDFGSYHSGGYIYEFRGRLIDLKSNLSQLKQLNWIDNRTRAILIELSLYNPNIDLYISSDFIFEFLSIGRIYSKIRFEPIDFQIYSSTIQIICLIIYMIIIISIIFKQIRLFFQLKFSYFKQYWSYIELSLIISSWLGLVIQLNRYRELKSIEEFFKETNGYVYINLQKAVFLNDLYTYMFAICWFIGTIKIVSLCQYDQRLSLFIRTLEYSSRELFSFVLMFSIVYVAFVNLFYLLFHSKIESCSNLFQTIGMLFQMILLHFNANEFLQVAPNLGPLCFSLFIFLVVFICMSMFLSIINENFRLARKNSISNEKIFSFMFEKFLYWTGLKRMSKWEEYERYDSYMRQEYFDPIERFPEKIDQLLQALNQIYIDQNNINGENKKETL